ncbi:MAG TPA: DUF992 domain-containing protein [Terriglobia bacterium]|nr:DUF992 domain-containing protein [Terriglobia bacterium]
MAFKSFGKQRGAIGICAALAVLAAPPAAQAAGGVNIGSLTCHVASGVSFIFGSSRDMNCVFSRPDGKTERYHGEIKRYGVDIGYVKSAEIVWGVFAPSGNVAPGSLVGTYLGGSANVTAGVGLGANALIGGSSKTISLQPLSLEGNTGLNIAGGIGEIELRQ